MDLTKRAYDYAVQKKKVNEGVIEAFKFAYELGRRDAAIRPTEELLHNIKSRYRSSKQVEYDLGMSDLRRNAKGEELVEIKKHNLIVNFIQEFESL